MVKLTARQRRFVEKYCENCGNGVKAVYQAGYGVSNDNSAAATASRLLRNVNVRAEIEAFEAKVTEAVKETAVYTREMALAEYNKAIEIAKKRKQANAYCKAITGKVRLYGLDKQVTEDNSERAPITRQELLDRLAELDELDAEANKIQMEVNKRVG